ncbi:hypothetical protein HOA55_03715 [archaeon]|jgi:hypothetical protein|nr:hypothetical protein [archaeon]MBT3577320.1 hypothetical protein [archaeon]MBT6820436.1 hypothetical protein [archaeon]MBT6956261.1 hypothetical protein [archaeon]MBT7025250.1 hypothetical protein [archaeon]
MKIKKKIKDRKKLIIKILLIVWALVTIAFIIGNPVTLLLFHKTTSAIVGCGGIGEYYSNTSFEEDYEILSADYGRCGDSGNGTIFNSGFHIYARQADKLCDGGHFDCNDYSNAVVCLGEKYGMECKPIFYLMSGNGGWLGLVGTHFKTFCENGEVYD